MVADRNLTLVAGTSIALAGGAIVSNTGDVNLTTGHLVSRNLHDYERSSGFSFSITGLDKLTGPSAPKTGKYVSPFLGEIEVGYTRKIKEGITYTVVGEGKIELTDPDANQTVLATLKRDEAGRQVVTVNSESGFEIVIPLVDFERLAFESGRIGDFIASLTTPVPDDVAAQGPEAEAQFRRLIANGIAPDRAGQIMATPEMQAHVRQLNRIQAAKNLGRPLTKDELLIIAMNEAAFFNAEGILSVPIDCSTVGNCEIAHDALVNSYRLELEKIKAGHDPGDRGGITKAFRNFIVACTVENPGLIYDVLNDIGVQAFTKLAETLPSGLQKGYSDQSVGYDAEVLIAAVRGYQATGDDAAFKGSVAVASRSFFASHSLTPEQREQQRLKLLTVGAAYVTAAGAILVTPAIASCAANPVCAAGLIDEIAGMAAQLPTGLSGLGGIGGIGTIAASKYSDDVVRAVGDVVRQVNIPVPAGYRPFKSNLSSAGGYVEDLPVGYQRVVDADGNVVIASGGGVIYSDAAEAWAARIRTPSELVQEAAGRPARAASINWGHILDGEINFRGFGTGGHYARSSNTRVTQVTKPADANGVIEARIQIRDPNTGSWIDKPAKTTIFPDHWSKRQVMVEIESAFLVSRPDPLRPGVWTGKSNSGVSISGYYKKPNGGAATAWPEHGK